MSRVEQYTKTAFSFLRSAVLTNLRTLNAGIDMFWEQVDETLARIPQESLGNRDGTTLPVPIAS